MRRTLDSVAAQTLPPALWVVVDDGSTDETPAILDEYSRELPYLKVVRRTDRGRRSVGPGRDRRLLRRPGHGRPRRLSDYLCKLDLDLDLPPRYFELLIERMEGGPAPRHHVGQAVLRPPADGALVPETCGDEMSVGMTQVLPDRLLPRDRRLRARGDVGRHRLPPLPHARLDRRERRRRRPALPPPAADGLEPARASGRAACAPGSGSTSWARRRSTTCSRAPPTGCSSTRC